MNQMKDSNNSFIIDNFDKNPTFTSFLPGLAGVHGCPLWSYYVNRGQGICSFGVHSKANAIMEFSPANLAYRRVSQDGFRTFLKKDGVVTELFAPSDNKNITRKMTVNMNSLSIEEENQDIKVSTVIQYFILPDEEFPALVRRVTLKNLSDKPFDFELLDGMGQLIPYGIENHNFKETSNLFRSWAEITWPADNIPMFNTRSMPCDEAEVLESCAAYFALSTDEKGGVIRPIIDTRVVFGDDETATFPWLFKTNSIDELRKIKEYPANRYPCVFTPISSTLVDNISFTSYFGFANTPQIILENYKKLCNEEYIDKAQKRASEIASEITFAAQTSTSSKELDNYFKQSYLDNVLRGGFPVVMGNENKKVVHLFSRKHGDPERDYNFFSLSAEPYSQGNGNFRDVNQNRRNDVLFTPEAGEFNVVTFMGLIGADGYNPLEIMGIKLMFINKGDAKAELAKLGVDSKFADKPFTVGELYLALKQSNANSDENLSSLLDLCETHLDANFKEGYWSDHFTYNLDLIESYAKIFPDKMQDLLFEENKCAIFYNNVEVLPRAERYKIINGKLRQKESIKEVQASKGSWLLDNSGNMIKTSVFSKLLLLIATKFSALDPASCGIEMEGGKPGWNDAMNGVPFFFGSGMSETIELKRIIAFALSQKDYQEITLPLEICELLKQLNSIQDISDSFLYWEKSSDIREDYRENLYKNGINGFSGKTTKLTYAEVTEMLTAFLERINKGISKAEQLGGGIIPTFIIFEALGLKDECMPTGFSARALPLFLEAPARMMKTLDDTKSARELYNKVLASECYDEKLKMYKTSVPLDAEDYGIGRIRAFTAGWLERESVFTHMSYKYLLGVLQAGLYDEFYKEIETGLVPFMDPEVYGRSIYENSSFIASSRNPDPTVWGRGFISRLSGSTAEVLSMRNEMFLGKKCFYVDDDGELCLTFSPVLHSRLFNENAEVMFILLGKIPVTYLNKTCKNTYGEHSVKPVKIFIEKQSGEIIIDGDTIKGEMAREIRDRENIVSIKVVLD